MPTKLIVATTRPCIRDRRDGLPHRHDGDVDQLAEGAEHEVDRHERDDGDGAGTVQCRYAQHHAVGEHRRGHQHHAVAEPAPAAWPTAANRRPRPDPSPPARARLRRPTGAARAAGRADRRSSGRRRRTGREPRRCPPPATRRCRRRVGALRGSAARPGAAATGSGGIGSRRRIRRIDRKDSGEEEHAGHARRSAPRGATPARRRARDRRSARRICCPQARCCPGQLIARSPAVRERPGRPRRRTR